jgi:hypothetical protein
MLIWLFLKGRRPGNHRGYFGFERGSLYPQRCCADYVAFFHHVVCVFFYAILRLLWCAFAVARHATYRSEPLATGTA